MPCTVAPGFLQPFQSNSQEESISPMPTPAPATPATADYGQTQGMIANNLNSMDYLKKDSDSELANAMQTNLASSSPFYRHPDFNFPRGRPRGRKSILYKCSICKGNGHSRRTCSLALRPHLRLRRSCTVCQATTHTKSVCPAQPIKNPKKSRKAKRAQDGDDEGDEGMEEGVTLKWSGLG